MPPVHSFLLRLLIGKGYCSSEDANALIESLGVDTHPMRRESAVYDAVIERQWLDEEALLQCIADREGIGFRSHLDVALSESEAQHLRAWVPAAVVDEFSVIPLESAEGELTLAQTYPCDYDALDRIACQLDMDVAVVLVPKASFQGWRNRLYGANVPEERVRVDESTSAAMQVSKLGMVQESPPSTRSARDGDLEGQVSRYVDWILTEAMRRRASDIHFEPMAQHFQIRCRVDGVLQRLDQPALERQEAILSRVKLMAGMDIAEKRLPQDGHFQVDDAERSVDFRVSTVPSTHGEGIVIRILDTQSMQLDLDELGMLPAHRDAFERAITAPDGMVLVTGPTGSGKSTTLYSALSHLNEVSRKILTIEDPVEIQMDGINQVQVRPEVELTFSAALRSMLRQAPNVIMVGEIRDTETADIAVHAALTGHAVFSTLHTNDAPSAFTRLMDMGVRPALLAAALRAVLAQRLVRRIAAQAALPFVIQPWQVRMLGPGFEELAGATFFQAGQDGSQYRGRLAIFEMVEVDEALRELMDSHLSLQRLRRFLHDREFASLRQDAVEKALMGWTTLDEVFAVTLPVDPATG